MSNNIQTRLIASNTRMSVSTSVREDRRHSPDLTLCADIITFSTPITFGFGLYLPTDEIPSQLEKYFRALLHTDTNEYRNHLRNTENGISLLTILENADEKCIFCERIIEIHGFCTCSYRKVYIPQPGTKLPTLARTIPPMRWLSDGVCTEQLMFLEVCREGCTNASILTLPNLIVASLATENVNLVVTLNMSDFLPRVPRIPPFFLCDGERCERGYTSVNRLPTDEIVLDIYLEAI